ncbi:MAG: DUF4367 domain-containing protein [Eubacteriales bacterium]|nr:DUF4367 domain-containing protein [Eubacteriales bacterium]
MKHKDCAVMKAVSRLLLCLLVAVCAAGCGKGAKGQGESSARNEQNEEERLTETKIALEDESGTAEDPEEDPAEGVETDEDGNPISEEDMANIEGEDFENLGIDGLPSPYVEYTDFDVFIGDVEIGAEELTNLPFKAKYFNYLLYNDGMYEIQYEDEDGRQVSFRKGKGTEDISGVYLDFEKKDIVSVNGREVRLSTADGKCLLAVWTDGTYAYSIFADPGCTKEQMIEMVSSVQPAGK